MALLFFILQFLGSVFLRCFLSRASLPIAARIVSLFQDLFITSLLFSILSISVGLAFCLSCLISLYVALDAFVFSQMKLRLQWRDLFYLRDAKTFFHSAKDMGFNIFFTLALFFVLGHIAAYFFYRSLEFSWNGTLLALFAVLALCSRLFLPKSIGYAAHHPFFLSQRTVSVKTSSFLKKGQLGNQTVSIQLGRGERPHIVFLFLESFPAKYVGSGITPHLDRWIQKGIYFSQFYSNGTLTYRAFLNGLFGIPPKNTSEGLSPYVDVPFRGIPEFLKSKGYKTAFHQSGSLSFDFQESFLQKHFDELADKQTLNVPLSQHMSWGVPDEYLMHYSANWLEKQIEPVFLTLFTISNHHPWVVPKTYSSSQKCRFLQTLEYTDYALGEFIRQLQDKNLMEKTILFILGDHGQPRGEHGGNFYNSRFLYEENVHVPLLILAKGRGMEPKVVDEIGSQMDLFPTILDLMGEKGSCLGSSLFRKCPKRTVFLQNPYSEGFLGCRKDRWKWIENSFSGSQELYDLAQDRQEMKNESENYPEIARSLKEEAKSFFAAVETFYQPCPASSSAHILDVSNSLITDEKLAALATPHLRKVKGENCLLLTDRGIAALLAQSPFLEGLHLKGVVDITDQAFEGVYPRLKTLDVSDAADITASKLAESFPYIEDLSFSAKNSVSFPLKDVIQLKIVDADKMTDDQMMELLQNNPRLLSLIVYGSAQITDQSLFAMKHLSLERLWLFDAPKVTEKGKEALHLLPLRSLTLNRGDNNSG